MLPSRTLGLVAALSTVLLAATASAAGPGMGGGSTGGGASSSMASMRSSSGTGTSSSDKRVQVTETGLRNSSYTDRTTTMTVHKSGVVTDRKTSVIR